MMISPLTLLGLLSAMLFGCAHGVPITSHLVLESPPGVADDLYDRPLRRIYLPIEMAPAALAGAFNAHAEAASLEGSRGGIQQDFPSDLFQQKRTTSRTEMFQPVAATSSLGQAATLKRKMFWQPLGYMPASARVHHSRGGSSGSSNAGNNRASVKDSGSNVFRYG